MHTINKKYKVKVDILLATFNGAAYLPKQLDSLLAQEFQNFSVMIRDDGSSDNTLAVIQAYQQAYPEKFIYIEDTKGAIGSSASFMTLLEYSQAEYVMFCDQDDIWLANKIKVSLAKIEAMQNQYKQSIPLLVFTDLQVVDSSLNVIADSFWQYQKLSPEITTSWKQLLAQNVISACTMIINERAREICLPYSLKLMHDQWIGVKVAKAGHIAYLTETTVLYRQHQTNVDGAHQFNRHYIQHKLSQFNRVIRKLQHSASYFSGVSFTQLLILKVWLNIKRIVHS